MLGWMLWGAGVWVSGLFPMFSPWAADHVAYTERMWCQMVVGLHKTRPGDVDRLWRWEFGTRELGVSLSRVLMNQSVIY